MKYINITLESDRGWFHPFDTAVESSDVICQSIHNASLLNDGTAVVLSEYGGPRRELESLLRDYYDPIDLGLKEWGSNTMVYMHFQPSRMEQRLLETMVQHPIVIDMPIRMGGGTELGVSAVGEREAFLDALDSIPDGVSADLHEVGDYVPRTERLFSSLTPVEKETLMKAQEMGYYEVPRGSTHADVARELGKSRSAVGEYLRRIESKIMRQVVP